MAEGNGTKIGIGCCSAVAVVVCAVAMIGVIWGKKAWTYFQTAAEERSQLIALVERWEDALDGAETTPQLLSPESVAGLQRKGQTLDAGPPGFSLEAMGLLDVYASGGDEIRIWIAETSQIDMTVAIETIKEQVDRRFKMKSKTSFFINGKGRLSYSGSPPDEQGLMLNTNDRIYLIQSNNKSADLQAFLEDYLEAGTQAAGDSDAGVGASAESEGKGSEVEEKTDPDVEPK